MRSMNVRLAAILATALVAAACSRPVTTTIDESPTASVPASTNAADVSDCRFQAARQAELRYPRQPLDDPIVGTRRQPIAPYDPGKGEAAQRFFNQCMTQKARLGPRAPASSTAS
jgi:hypothetical protein